MFPKLILRFFFPGNTPNLSSLQTFETLLDAIMFHFYQETRFKAGSSTLNPHFCAGAEWH